MRKSRTYNGREVDLRSGQCNISVEFAGKKVPVFIALEKCAPSGGWYNSIRGNGIAIAPGDDRPCFFNGPACIPYFFFQIEGL